MDIERAVHDFVLTGKNLFHHLRSEGESLSDLTLGLLQTQLHILYVETARLEHIKLFRANTTPGETSPTQSPLLSIAKKRAKPPNKCLHQRLIDYCVSAHGERNGLVYCLECGAIIKDPYSKPE